MRREVLGIQEAIAIHVEVEEGQSQHIAPSRLAGGEAWMSTCSMLFAAISGYFRTFSAVYRAKRY